MWVSGARGEANKNDSPSAHYSGQRASDVDVCEGQCDDFQSRIQKGLSIAPVPLNLEGKNGDLVGLGSYLVNAVAGCNDCHTCPSYDPNDNPYKGQPGKINARDYLAGGVPFGPFISRNITPDASGKPAGMAFEEFLHVMRTGEDIEHEHPQFGPLLQVRPWPVYRHMDECDIRAIYEYLRAIPHAEPGSCSSPGQ
ncbi:Nicotinate dehydrogenase subunit B [bacterium HR10]|nr:Nicotinate dehydrogenase subunit B [bacterium HR10]